MVLCSVPTTWKWAWLGAGQSVAPWDGVPNHLKGWGGGPVEICFRDGQSEQSLDKNVAEGTEGKEIRLEQTHTALKPISTP